jgi:serine/threonine-protein kinase ATR
MLTNADALLNQFEVFEKSGASLPKVLPFAVEAAWTTSKWDKLDHYLKICAQQNISNFSTGVGSALSSLRRGEKPAFKKIIEQLRYSVARSLTSSSIASLQSCHDNALQLHALTEIESIANMGFDENCDRSNIIEVLNRRLDILGGYISDKQYLLGLRRAAMELS